MNATVWITGIGVVSPAGDGVAELRSLLAEGRQAVRPQDHLGGANAGAGPEPNAGHDARRFDRSAQYFLLAAEQAWADAGLDSAGPETGRWVILEGSSLGSMADVLTSHRRMVEGGDRRAKPSYLVRYLAGAGGALFAQRHDIHGRINYLAAGSVSGLCAIGEGYERVAFGQADVAIVGGAECPLHPEIQGTFAAAGVLAGRRDDGRCLPFDRRRAGTVLGEGSGVVVLESEAHARARGVRPRAVIEGFGITSEGYGMTAPHPEGLGVARAVEEALNSSGRSTEDVGWIKAHGTGTRANDLAECRGLAKIFGEQLRDMPLTSLKSALGHSLGASGAVETVATVIALEDGFVPATIGTEEVDPQLPPCSVTTQVHDAPEGSVLLLAESFGGRCGAMLVGRG